MMTLDISMGKAQYRSGEPISVHIKAPEGAKVSIAIRRLADEPVAYCEGMSFAEAGGYGVDAEVDGVALSTAFDVVNDWRERIRYAFLSDFSAADISDDGDISWLAKAHFNAVQFYDWMYRHESLLPPESVYTDPLGRELSLPAVLEKIDGCRARGMAPIAYGAVYASSRAFWEERKQWGLYSKDERPMSFGGWLQFMDISRGSLWREHILREFGEAVQYAGFMGVHMDTYGFPKNAYNADGAPVDLAAEFPSFIGDAKERLKSIDPDSGAIFNCVGNWPVEAVGGSPADAVYIEVWPPCERYGHLAALVRGGLVYGGKKPVILAAYMSPFKEAETPGQTAAAENALLLAFSVIHASGGTQLVLGENACVLCDPYYVEHRALSGEFIPVIQKYLDHCVRTSELMDMRLVEDVSAEFTGGINTEFRFSGAKCSPFPEAGAVWTAIGRTTGHTAGHTTGHGAGSAMGYTAGHGAGNAVGSVKVLAAEPDEGHTVGKYVIQLVNLTGIENDLWNAPHTKPEAVENLQVEALVDYEIGGVYSASPDLNDGRPQTLAYTTVQTERGNVVCFAVGPVAIWTTVWIEFSV